MRDENEVKIQLFKLADQAKKLSDILQAGDTLESWAESKIAKAAEYVTEVCHYMEYQTKVSDLDNQFGEVGEKYSESVRRSFQQKLTEAKCNLKKLSNKKMKEALTNKPSEGMTKKEKSAVVKKAKAGKDIGKPGKNFGKVEAAAKKSGAKDPKAVAAAAMWKNLAKK